MTTPSARASTPRSRRSCSADTRSAPSRTHEPRSSTGSKPGTTASGATPASATAHPPTTNAKGVTASGRTTERISLKKEQELPNVYVSTEAGAVHQRDVVNAADRGPAAKRAVRPLRVVVVEPVWQRLGALSFGARPVGL